jgi:hypothetical protein
MFETFRGPLALGSKLLLRTILYAECPPLLAIHVLLDLAGHVARGEVQGVAGKQEVEAASFPQAE